MNSRQGIFNSFLASLILGKTDQEYEGYRNMRGRRVGKVKTRHIPGKKNRTQERTRRRRQIDHGILRAESRGLTQR